MKYNTGKRENILAFFKNNAEASFTLEAICEAIAPDGNGKSTVYRIVSELVCEGKLRRLSDGRTRHCTYQYIGNDECKSHMHLKCRNCGRLIHLDDKLSHEFASILLSEGGFAIETGCMLFGKCSECGSTDGTEHVHGEHCASGSEVREG